AELRSLRRRSSPHLHPVRPQPDAREAKGGRPSDRFDFAAADVVAGARRLPRGERSHDRGPGLQAGRPHAGGQDGRVVPGGATSARGARATAVRRPRDLPLASHDRREREAGDGRHGVRLLHRA
ncbi:MAG: hypothetical protein AVDCRST_MAG20-1607, partial [uncultured Acidimicrobiales bacterium]